MRPTRIFSLLVVLLLTSALVSADSLEVANVTLYLVGLCKQSRFPDDGLPYDRLDSESPPCHYYEFSRSEGESLSRPLSEWDHTVNGSFELEKPHIFGRCKDKSPYFKTKNPDTEAYYDGTWLVIVVGINSGWMDLKQLRLLKDKKISEIEDNLFPIREKNIYLDCTFHEKLEIIHAKNFKPVNISEDTEIQVGRVNTTFDREIAGFIVNENIEVDVYTISGDKYFAYRPSDQREDPYPSRYPKRVLILSSWDLSGWGYFRDILSYLDWIRESEVVFKREYLGTSSEGNENTPLFDITTQIVEDSDNLTKKFEKLENDLESCGDNSSKKWDYVNNFSDYLSEVDSHIFGYTKKLRERRPTDEAKLFTQKLGDVLGDGNPNNPAYSMYQPTLQNYYRYMDRGYELAEDELRDLKELYADRETFVLFEREYIQGIVESERWENEFDEIKKSREEAWWFNILSIVVLIISIIVVLGSGLYTIKKADASARSQIKRLDNVAKHITNATDRQIAETKKSEFEKKQRAIKALISEIEFNIGLAKEIMGNKEVATRENDPIRPFRNFMLINMKNVLTNHLIEDINISNNLWQIYSLFETCNNLMQLTRLPSTSHSLSARTMETVLSNLSKENVDKIHAAVMQLSDIYEN